MGQSIKKATVISYITLVIGNIISLIYTPFMLSTLGSNEYGLFSLVNNIISYIYLLDMGMGNAVIRYNSRYMANNDKEGLKVINGMFLSMYIIIAIIGVVIGVILYSKIDILFGQGLSNIEINKLKTMFVIAIINVIFSFPLNVFSGIIVSNEKFVYNKILTLFRTVLNPMIMVSILILGYKSIGMIIASTIFNISLGFINIIYCFKILKIKFIFRKFDKNILKEIFNYSFYIFLGDIAFKLYWSTDQIILGMFVSSASIAIYSIGAQFNGYFTSFSNVITGMFLPKMTKLVVNEPDNNKLMDILVKISRIQFYIAIFILMGFILVGKTFINLWAGEGYETSYYIALLIMFPQIFSIIQALFATMLDAMNKHKIKSFIYLSVSILNLVLSIIFVKSYGLIGCSLATSIGMTINALLNNIYYKYNLKLNMKYYWKEISKLFIPTIVCFFIGLIMVNNIVVNSYISLIIFIILFSIIYIIVYWIFGFNDYEKLFLLAMIEQMKFKIKFNKNKFVIKE